MGGLTIGEVGPTLCFSYLNIYLADEHQMAA